MSDAACDLLCLDLELAEALRASALDAAAADAAARRAKALGDPTRLSIALALRDGGELCGCDLAWVVGRPQNLVSHHVRALRAEGLLTSRRNGRMVMFSLTEPGVALVTAVVGDRVAA